MSRFGGEDRRPGSKSRGSGGFNKHTHSLEVTKHIPKFLQNLGVKSEASLKAEEAIRSARERPTRDEELPEVANLEEFLQGASGVDREKLKALLRSEEEGGEPVISIALPGQQSDPQSAAGAAPLSAPPAARADAAAPPQFGRQQRVEDPEADAIEAASGRHLYRPRAAAAKRKAAPAAEDPPSFVGSAAADPPPRKADTLEEVIARYLEKHDGSETAADASQKALQRPAAAEGPAKKKLKTAAKPSKKPALSFNLDEEE